MALQRGSSGSSGSSEPESGLRVHLIHVHVENELDYELNAFWSYIVCEELRWAYVIGCRGREHNASNSNGNGYTISHMKPFDPIPYRLALHVEAGIRCSHESVDRVDTSLDFGAFERQQACYNDHVTESLPSLPVDLSRRVVDLGGPPWMRVDRTMLELLLPKAEPRDDW